MDDRISELPDEILSDMLTRLSMKDLLETSILSKRWRNLWTLRKYLFFDIFNMIGSEEKLLKSGYLIDVTSRDRCFDFYKTRDEFVKRVDQFLHNFSGTLINSFLVNFYLNCEQSNNIDQWINFAIARGVGRIDLLFGQSIVESYPAHPDPHPRPSNYYRFAFDVFSEANALALKHLRLECCIVCNPTNCDFIPFKNLKYLSLTKVKVDEMLIESLLSDCQLLEELCLDSCKFKSSTPKIVSSSLLHLKVTQCYKVIDNGMTDLNLILVDCLKLTSLEYDGKCFYILNINTPVLKSINLDMSIPEDLNSFALCATFPQLEIMHLTIYYMVITSLKIIQPLQHLKQLDFIICYPGHSLNDDEYDLLWILNILQASPLLHKLSIKVLVARLFENHKDTRDIETFSHDKLKFIEFEDCVGNWFEIEFIMNVLKYDKLEQIVVRPSEGEEDDSLDCNSDPGWFLGARERISEKLQGVVGREKLLLL